jgi:hypothetical protein
VAATPPKVTELPAGPVAKPVPESVTDVPPAEVPELGDTFARTGGGATGVTAFEGAEAGPAPTAFVAETRKVYALPFESPVTDAVVPVTVKAADGAAGATRTE